MAVRGLGCPVRFTLTAGQKGDAPQADALIEGLPADIFLADTAYDSDRLRNAVAEKGAVAVIPNNPSLAQKYPLDKHLYAQRHLIEMLLLKAEAVPQGGHALRQNRQKLPRHRHNRCHLLWIR
jgi:transposase